MDRRQIISDLKKAERRVADAAKTDAQVLRRSYGPGKWNGLQLICHIADSDLNILARFLRAVAENGAPVYPFDENKWMAELRGGERPTALSVDLVRAATAVFCHYLETLPDASLEHTILHPVMGEQKALAIAAHAARHSLHHVEQLDAILEGREWVKGKG